VEHEYMLSLAAPLPFVGSFCAAKPRGDSCEAEVTQHHGGKVPCFLELSISCRWAVSFML